MFIFLLSLIHQGSRQASFLLNQYYKTPSLLALFAALGQFPLSVFFRSVLHCRQTQKNKGLEHLKNKIIFALNIPLPFLEKVKIKPNTVKLLTFIVVVMVASLLDEKIAFASNDGTQIFNFPSELLNEFETVAKEWGPAIEGFSLSLFKWLMMIEIGWFGIQAVVKGYDLKQIFAEFLLLIIYACFMVAIIYYHNEWMTALINSFSSVAKKTGAPEANPTAIFLYGYDIICQLIDEMSLVDSVGIIFCCLIIAITFTLITAQVVLVKCEAYIVLNAGAILLGFGGSKLSKDYAINFLRYALAVAVKLFVLQLLMGMSMSFIVKFTTVNTKNFSDILLVVCSSILILALVKSIPDIVSGIVNGSHVSTGSALTSAVSAVGIASMAVGRAPAQALGGAVEAKRGFDTTREAFSMAGSQGATGFAKGMQAAKNLSGAMRDNIGDSDMGNLRSSMVARHESFKMDQANSGPSDDFQHP